MDNLAPKQANGNKIFLSQPLSPSERRLVLRASLTLLLRRLAHNIAVRRKDLEYPVPYGDDAAPEARA